MNWFFQRMISWISLLFSRLKKNVSLISFSCFSVVYNFHKGGSGRDGPVVSVKASGWRDTCRWSWIIGFALLGDWHVMLVSFGALVLCPGFSQIFTVRPLFCTYRLWFLIPILLWRGFRSFPPVGPSGYIHNSHFIYLI